jgi:hypothetical protein
MSKRHQASRRRMYGRRQHEIHERRERAWPEPDEARDGQEKIASSAERPSPLGGFAAYLAAFAGAD